MRDRERPGPSENQATSNGNQLLLSCQSGSALYTVTLTALLEATNNWSVDIDDGFLRVNLPNHCVTCGARSKN